MAYRLIYTDFWKDPNVLEEFTPEDKLFFIYVLTNQSTTACGVYQITKKQMAFDIGYSLETVNSLLKRLIERDVIKYNTETKELAIKNWGKYNLNKGGKPVIDCLKKELLSVKDKSLIEYVSNNIKSDCIKQVFDNFVATGEIYFEPSKTSKPKSLQKISTREYVICRDKQICFYTGKKLQRKDIDVDHVNPKSNNGEGYPDNLVVTSASLNRSKSNDTLEGFCKRNDLDYPTIRNKVEKLKEFENIRMSNNMTYRETIDNNIHTLEELNSYLCKKYESYEKNQNLNTIQNTNTNTNTIQDTETYTDTCTETNTSTNKHSNFCSSETNIYKLYEKCGFGLLNRVIMEFLEADVEMYGEVWVTDAMKEAVKQNKNNLKYVEGILRNWKANGRKESSNEFTENISSNSSESKIYNGYDFTKLYEGADTGEDVDTENVNF